MQKSTSGLVGGARMCLIVFVLVACDQKPPKHESSSSEIPTDAVEQASSSELSAEDIFGPPGSTIDGREWTLAKLSDSFDGDLTPAKAKSVFGDSPIEEREGTSTLLTYIVETDDVYVPGVRVTSIVLIFVDDDLANVRFGFTTYHDR